MSVHIEKSVWLAMIEDNLFDNMAIKSVKKGLKDDSAYRNAATVVIPNAGSPAVVTMGNDTYPVSIGRRDDQPQFYHMTNLEVGPVLVQYKEEIQIAYNKAESILNDSLQGIGLKAARKILHGQYDKEQDYVETSGDSVGVGHAPGCNTAMQGITFEDVRNAVAKLAKQDVDGEFELFIDTTMYFQLLADLQEYGNYTFPDEKVGFKMPNINNVNVYRLTNLLYADASRNIRDIDNTTGATTDKAVALLVSKKATSYAMDAIQAFVEPNKTDYFGATYSMTTWVGGKYRRLDKKGVVPIVQAAV